MSNELRRAFGHYPTGVTVITTTTQEGRWIGMTANSFSSLSLDPPLVLWSIARSSTNYDVFRNATHFAVHVLHSGQAALARQFATRDCDRFAGLQCEPGRGGSPLLEDFHACFDCETHEVLEGGDHVIIVGRVLECRERAGDPLIFYRGRFLETLGPGA
ncbi:MAG TPA: flavin reductase family protein [Steroidobacteraceae bacterium]|jgi:flavin reductase (DIM6/NTAB) family NADH-FMN oxidoreductase RutF|nr:flavin reductase family protein [Steroidobacteraceae bacterium]